jgi:hypothetical protein
MNRQDLIAFHSSPRASTLPREVDAFRGLEEIYSSGAVLPEQLYNPRGSVDRGSAVIELMCAVLADALNCVHRQPETDRPSTRRLAREAEEWLWADDVHWPFSFLNICTALNLDPTSIRRQLVRWRQSSSRQQLRSKRRSSSRRRPLSRMAARRLCER